MEIDDPTKAPFGRIERCRPGLSRACPPVRRRGWYLCCCSVQTAQRPECRPEHRSSCSSHTDQPLDCHRCCCRPNCCCRMSCCRCWFRCFFRRYRYYCHHSNSAPLADVVRPIDSATAVELSSFWLFPLSRPTASELPESNNVSPLISMRSENKELIALSLVTVISGGLYATTR